MLGTKKHLRNDGVGEDFPQDVGLCEVILRKVVTLAGFLAGSAMNLPAMHETQVRSLSQEDYLGKGMTTHSSILVLEVPWMEEPAGLQSMGLHKVRHN